MQSFLRRYWPRAKPFAVLCMWTGVVGSIFLFLYIIYLKNTLPDPESIAERQVKESTKLYDKTGTVLLYDIYKEEKRTIIPWEQIPQGIKDATIASEDSNFYKHGGVDFKGIVRSFLRDIQSGHLAQGGSTITQQLVKNALLGQEKTFSRKIRELMLAVEIERRFTKDQILWMYLNQIPYGSTAYGVEAASLTYFGKPAAQLTPAEAATLASMVQAPTYFSPFGSHVPELLARKDFVLQRMRTLGFLSDDAYHEAAAQKIMFTPGLNKLTAPHFVLMVKDYLVQKYGEDVVENGGLKITTTLDADLQKNAEDLVAKYAAVNKQKYKASNAALVAIDPKTGGILALVGSANYFDTENQGNYNVATALRQPGSAFKPFAYATAFMKGYPDSTILFDVKTEFNPSCSPDGLQTKDRFGLECYHPQNYDASYHGAVTLRQALDQSLNIPSVKTLYLAGIDDTINLAQRMGITTLTDRSRYGLSLVLGGAEVRLVDLVSAYGVFANEGIRNPWGIVQRIERADGTVLEDRKPESSRVLDANIARLVSDVLSDNNARAPVFGYNSPLYIPGRDVAVKTGTTQSNRDAWAVGYTPSLAVGVWTGNNDNTPMTRAGAGISAAGPLWHEFLVTTLGGSAGESFTKPEPVLSDKIMLNGTYLYQSPNSATPEIHTILYYVDRNNPLGGFPGNPDADPQFSNWEWAVHNLFRP